MSRELAALVQRLTAILAFEIELRDHNHPLPDNGQSRRNVQELKDIGHKLDGLVHRI